MSWKSNSGKFEWIEPGPIICKYNYLIRSITTRSHKTLKDITPNCTQLTFLELDFKFMIPKHHKTIKIHAWNSYMHDYRQDSDATLTTLIRQNLGLETVHICLGADDSFETILGALGELQGLKELILSDYLLDQRLRDLKTVLSKCKRLKRFAYGSTLDSMEGLFSPEEHLDKDFRLEMGQLTMGGNLYELEQLILVHNIVGQRNIPTILESCPKLWSLRLPFLNVNDHSGLEHVVRHHCRYIQNVRVTVGEMAIYLLNDMLRSIVRLTSLMLEYSTVTTENLSTLIFSHGTHLRRLSLLRGMSTIERGQAIVQILQSCPNLESFVSDHPIHGCRLVGLSPRVPPSSASGTVLIWPLKLKRLSLCVVKEYRFSLSRIPGQGSPSMIGTSTTEYQWEVLDAFSRRTMLGCNLVFVELIRPPVTKQLMQYHRIEWDENLVLDFLRRAKELREIVVEGNSFRRSI
ncbi:hypothetical protein BGZ81_001355 [Podila clonocystis]|nr:hypothetical protein BGZ81_001355 [Podila clonocystis]